MSRQPCRWIDASAAAGSNPVPEDPGVGHHRVEPAEALESRPEELRGGPGKRGTPDHVRVHTEFPRTVSGRVILRELDR